ncbi:MAG: efflux RND transporter permease subunit [Paracoccaceae bacterium]|jgi:multidrug efflux pump subunit AcrB|nr:efflux RND transporter permease subunit [Paracoccaceae bacterium]
MERLILWFRRDRVAANLLALVLVAAGLASAATLTVRTFPEIATGAVQVSVAYPGASPSDVADAVLTPIEEELRGIEGVRELRGQATRGAGTVTAELTRGAAVREVKDDIETRVARIATFPDGARDPRIAEVEPTELAIQIALHGDTTRTALKALGEQVRRDLTARSAISRVTLAGTAPDMIEIEVPRATLQSYMTGLVGLGERIEAGTLDLTAGRVDTGESALQVRAPGEARDPDAYRDLVVFTGPEGAQVRLGEIAQIASTRAEEAVSAEIDGQPAVFVSVERAGQEQVLAIVDSVQAYLDDALRPRLPDGIEATVWRNSGAQLQGRIDLLAKNGAIGAGLILLLLMVFLDMRVAAWVAGGVAIAFAAAFVPMQAFGVTINQLSLFGFILALGIVVDDAIVVGESTWSALQEGRGAGGAAAEAGVLAVWRPILFSVVTTILAFVPLLFLPGSSGSFIGPVAAVVIFVLAFSLVESFLILPRHLSAVSAEPPRGLSPRRLAEPPRRWLAGGPLQRVVRGAIRFPAVALAGALAAAIATAGLFSGGIVKFVFFPEVEGNFVTADLRLPEGTSEEETLTRAEAVAAAARAVAEDLGEAGLLEATAITVGFAPGAQGPNEGGGVRAGNRAIISARLKDASARETDAATFEAAWREAVLPVAGAREVLFSASLVGVGAPVALEVSGADATAREAAVERLTGALEGRAGVHDIRDDRISAAREAALALSPTAESLGIPLGPVAREVRAALYGVTIDQFARDREEVDVRLRLPENQRDSVDDLYALDIPTEAGRIGLPVLADVALRPAPISVSTVGGREVTTVSAEVDQAVTTGGAEVAWLRQEVIPGLETDYPGLRVEAGGEQEEAGRFGSALALNFALTLAAMYAVLSLAFGSYLRPLIVLSVVPFGLVGAILGHAALGLDLTLLSMFGIIGLSGVVVNGALLIVTVVLREQEAGADPRDAIERATLSRFRPVLLTTLTTFLGVTPIILERSVQAQFLIPTAVSLGFGILFVLVVQMTLVPALCAIYAGAARRIHRLRRPAGGAAATR